MRWRGRLDDTRLATPTSDVGFEYEDETRGLHDRRGTMMWMTIIGDSARGWVSAVGYFSIAALVLWAVWRGKRGDVDLEEGAV